MEEHFFQCPYCWEQISMLVDTSVQQQIYVEDCEVCCNPIEIEITTQSGEVTSINANLLDQ